MSGLSNILWSLGAVAVLVFINGFFVAAEFALVTVRRTRIEELVSEGVSGAKAVRSALSQIDRYIAGTQIGITIASLALGWIGEPTLAKLLLPAFASVFPEAALTVAAHSVSVGLSFAIITSLHVILGELVPKSLALQRTETTALLVAPPMRLIVLVLQPFIWSLNGIGNRLLRLLKLDPAGEKGSVHSAAELELLVRQSHEAGELDDLERLMLQRTFRFSETTVADIMVPRSEMYGLNIEKPVSELLDEAAGANHTRMPVYEGGVDRVIGIVYIHDLFRLTRQKGDAALDLRAIVRPPLLVPETLHLDRLIDKFREAKMHIAIVIDEYGGTGGLVTLEDLVESVFGDLEDQNEETAPQFTHGRGGALIIRGDTRLADLKDRLGWAPDDDDADTLGGWIMAKLGRVAKLGDMIEVEQGRFRVIIMDRLRIVEVVFSPKKAPRAEEPRAGAPRADAPRAERALGPEA